MQLNLILTDTGLAQRKTNGELDLSAERRVRALLPPSFCLSLIRDRGRGCGVTSGLFTTHR